MINLAQIHQEVNHRIQNSSDLILRVWQNLIRKHNEFCECNYCDKLDYYVLKKKALHRVKINLDRDYFEIQLDTEGLIEIEKTLKEKVSNLKLEKDQIKIDYINQIQAVI